MVLAQPKGKGKGGTMALANCKECGAPVSKAAKACPKCGEPAKKRTSPFTWIIAIISVFWIFTHDWSEQSPREAHVSQGNTPTSAPTETQPKSTDTPRVYPMKKTVAIGYTSYAVWEAMFAKKLKDNPQLSPVPNATFLLVRLTVRNDDKEARSIVPFKLIDESGAEYETSSAAWAIDGNIGVLESLNPGVSKEGFVVFDVPRNHEYYLKISGGYWSRERALVKLSIK